MRTFAEKPRATRQTKPPNSTRASPTFSGQHYDVHSTLRLQRALGNQAVQRLLQAHSESPEVESSTTATTRSARDLRRIPLYFSTRRRIQPKLTIHAPGDSYEQEADRIIDQVMHILESTPQLTCPGGGRGPKYSREHSGHNPLQIKPVQEHDGGEAVAPPIVQQVIIPPGQLLDSTTRQFMESRFGHDFSSVRVHTDAWSAESARAVGARAYTVGSRIVFGAGQYAPGTTEGRRLLAHELTHVIQQQGPLSPVRAARLQRQVPQDITAEVGPVSGQGGLIHDPSRKRMSIMIGPDDTLRTIARRLLPIWNNARPYTPPGTATPRPVTQLTEEQLAKGLLVYNRYYLAVPSMTEWKVGLRFPLPIDVNQMMGERGVHPDLIATWASAFDPAWVPLLDMTSAATAAPNQAALEQSVQTFLQETPNLTARGVHLAARAMRNAREAEPFIQEVFRQAASEAFGLALSFMDQMVIHQFDLLVSQAAGQGIIDMIRNSLATAPATLSPSQQESLARANRLLSRLGVFSPATAERFRDIYVTRVPGTHCMAAVYHGFEGLFSEGVSRSIRDQVGRESREVMRRTGRNTDHMDRIMETVRARGMAGSETQLVYQASSNTWQPDPEATVLRMTQPNVSGWYFFGLSLHAAYHSVILAVDRTDPTNPRIYWMDQFSRGFSNDVTGTLMRQMRRFSPGYGFAPSRLWQIIPAADTLITLH